MKEYVMIPFKVEEEKLEEAKQIINELISNVRENEPGTLLYKSLQTKDDPATFVNFIIFADNEAQMEHRSAKYVMDFVKKLYNICLGEPHPLYLEHFDSCGIVADAIDNN